MKVKRYIASSTGLFLGLANVTLAQSQFNFRQVWLNQPSSNYSGNIIIDLLQSIGGFLIIVGTVVAGIAIVWSGLAYMAAGSNSAKVASAKTIFKNGIIGGAIVFAIGTIMQTLIALLSDPTSFFS